MVLSVFFFCSPASGDQSLSGAAKAESSKINITADKLTSRNDSNMAEFSGNVTAIYKGTTINSDILTIYYKNRSKPAPDGKSDDPRIEKIVADGHVTIMMDDKTALCDRALYTPDTGEIVLSGDNAQIKGANDYINGKEITINRNTGEITVVGNGTNRVEAVFQSSDKDVTNNAEKKKTGE